MWKCKNCNETNEDNFEICWNCQYGKDGRKPHIIEEEIKQKKDESKKKRESINSIKKDKPKGYLEKNFFKIRDRIFYVLAFIFTLGIIGHFIFKSDMSTTISHTALSISFLVVITIVAYIHLIILYYVISLILHILKIVLKTPKGKGYFSRLKENFDFVLYNHISKKSLLITFILFITLSTGVYLQQRAIWINSKSYFLNAKEYFVVGNTLSQYRQLLSKVFFPDSFFLEPLNLTQRLIYNTGIQYISKSDAEASMWYGMWFVKSYSKRMYIGSKPKEHNDMNSKRNRYLEETYPHLITLGTKELKDPLMYKIYLLSYPNMMAHFAYFQTRSTSSFGGSVFRFYPEKYIRDRNVYLFKALMNFKKKWREDYISKWGKYLVDTDEKTKADRQTKIDQLENVMYEIPIHTAMMDITEILIDDNMRKMNMNICEEEFIKEYSISRNRLFGMKGDGLRKYVDSNLRGNLDFMWGINNIKFQYIANDICGYPTSLYGFTFIEMGIEKAIRKFYPKEFYMLMKNFEKKGINKKAVESLKKYIEPLKEYEHYRKKFKEAEIELNKRKE